MTNEPPKSCRLRDEVPSSLANAPATATLLLLRRAAHASSPQQVVSMARQSVQ